MSDAIRVSDGPIAVEIEAGQNYAWCSCGQSKKSPFCDGTHRYVEGGFKPHKFVAEKSQKVYFCGCRATAQPPFCDGSHKRQHHEC